MSLFGIEGFAKSIPPGIEAVKGSIIIPSRRSYESASAKSFRKNGEYRNRLLLDPQLYLTELDPNRYRKRCGSLASYGWFECGDLEFTRTGRSRTPKKWADKRKKEIPKYWSGKLSTGDDIDSDVRTIVATSTALGCEAIILPAPMTANPNSDLGLELEWLDRGIAVARKENPMRLPVFASVALSDRVLIGINPFENALIDTIVDQISTRKVDGVYVVLELSATTLGYYLGNRDAVGAILRMVDAFKRSKLRLVVVNYATVAGLLAVVAGADTLCTGWYRSERRLRIDELAEDEKGGLSNPAYYSHALASEIHVAEDLMRVAKSGRFKEIADETPFSAGLLRALASNRTNKDIPEWVGDPGVHTASREHFYAAIGREVETLRGMTQEKRFDYAANWLAKAEELAEFVTTLATPGKPLNARTELNHQAGWKKAFEEFREKR